MRMILARDLESNTSRSEFLQRIASIPVVYLAWNIAAETYNNVKSSHKILKVSLNTTEKAASFISEPILRRFEKQLKSADHIACRGLETLEGIVPSIINQRKKFYRQTKSVYDDTVESGLKKYQVVKKLSTSKFVDIVNDGTEKLEEFLASPYGEVCDIAIDFVLDVGEMYVDHFLPPLGDERPEKMFGDRGKEPLSTRTELLRNRLKERFYKHSLLKIQSIKLRTKIFVIKIFQINLYQYVVETSAAIPEMNKALFKKNKVTFGILLIKIYLICLLYFMRKVFRYAEENILVHCFICYKSF
ncbi:perilipin-3 [Trichonephila clavipes]|nr:perilipin-3 [Trichonephila clavipes]